LGEAGRGSQGELSFIFAFSTGLALKVTTRRAEISIASPVLGFLPIRVFLSRGVKLPNPEIFSFSPR
jgi:hypothetical protein